MPSKTCCASAGDKWWPRHDSGEIRPTTKSSSKKQCCWMSKKTQLLPYFDATAETTNFHYPSHLAKLGEKISNCRHITVQLPHDIQATQKKKGNHQGRHGFVQMHHHNTLHPYPRPPSLQFNSPPPYPQTPTIPRDTPVPHGKNVPADATDELRARPPCARRRHTCRPPRHLNPKLAVPKGNLEQNRARRCRDLPPPVVDDALRPRTVSRTGESPTNPHPQPPARRRRGTMGEGGAKFGRFRNGGREERTVRRRRRARCGRFHLKK